jgi:hypothetical protein
MLLGQSRTQVPSTWTPHRPVDASGRRSGRADARKKKAVIVSTRMNIGARRDFHRDAARPRAQIDLGVLHPLVGLRRGLHLEDALAIPGDPYGIRWCRGGVHVRLERPRRWR